MKLISDEFDVLSSNIIQDKSSDDGDHKRSHPEIKNLKLRCKDCKATWTSSRGNKAGEFTGTKSVEVQCIKCDNYGVISFKNA